MSVGKIKAVAFSEGTAVSAPTTPFVAANSLQTYANDAAFVTAKGSAAAVGDMYHNTTLNVIREYDGAWRTIVTETALTGTVALGSATTSGTLATRGDLYLQGTGETQPLLLFYEAASAGSNRISLKAPASLGSDYDLTLPLTVGGSGQFLTTNGSGTLDWTDGGGGSGEINAVTNPSASSATTGYTAGTSHTVARDTSNSPLSPVTATCLDISSSASAAESSTSGVYYSISTMPTSLRSKKLKVEFYVTVPATDVWRLSVYAGSTRLNLSTDSSSVTTLPAGFTGKFTAYFDTTTATAYSVNFTNTTRSGTTHLYVTSLIVGPGIQPQGAAVSETFSYTPTIGNMTTSAATGRWQRVGDKMLLEVACTASANATGVITFSIPSGYTIDTTKLASGGTDQVEGSAYLNENAGNLFTGVVNYASSTALKASSNNSTNYWNATNPIAGGVQSGDKFSITAVIPIAEWAGSSQANLAQNDVEYASVGGTWDAASSTTVYGPAGSAMGGALTASRVKTITWRTPVQATDRIQLWFSKDQVNWFPAVGSHIGSGNTPVINVMDSSGSAATTGSGIYWRPGSTAYETEVQFARYANIANDDSPTADWPSSSAYWVATKTAAGQAVGFGAATSTTSGLVNATTQTFGGAKTFNNGIAFAGGGTNLNHYQSTTASVTWNAGAFTGGSAQAVTAVITRIGNVVTVELPGVSATTNATSAEMTTSANPLSSFAPASNMFWPLVTQINGGAIQLGWLSINSSGGLAVEFYPNASTTVTSGSTSVGYRRTSVTYTLP